MGISHSLDESQAQDLSNAIQNTTMALRHLEEKTRMVETYFKESTSAQQEVTQSAKEVAETIETMTKLVNSRSDDMQAQWLSFTDTAKIHSSRAVSAINKINLKNITTRVPLELVSLGRPMILFLIISACSNLFFGFLLCTDDVRRAKITDGTSFGYWIDGLAWMHISIFLFVFLWMLFERVRTSKCCHRRIAQWRPSHPAKTTSSRRYSRSIYQLSTDIAQKAFRGVKNLATADRTSNHDNEPSRSTRNTMEMETP